MPPGLSELTHSVKMSRMAKPEQTTAQFAANAAAPLDLAGASQFRRQGQQNDRVRTAIMIGVGIALLAFFGSMIAVLMMHAPTL
jgi:hypothetical protein